MILGYWQHLKSTLNRRMESPELDANMVFREEFTATEISGDLEYSSEVRQISAVLSPMFL